LYLVEVVGHNLEGEAALGNQADSNLAVVVGRPQVKEEHTLVVLACLVDREPFVEECMKVESDSLAADTEVVSTEEEAYLLDSIVTNADLGKVDKDVGEEEKLEELWSSVEEVRLVPMEEEVAGKDEATN